MATREEPTTSVVALACHPAVFPTPSPHKASIPPTSSIIQEKSNKIFTTEELFHKRGPNNNKRTIAEVESGDVEEESSSEEEEPFKKKKPKVARAPVPDESDQEEEENCTSSFGEDDEYIPLDDDNFSRAIKRMSVTLGLNFENDNVSNHFKVLLESSSDETKTVFNKWAPSVSFQWLALRYSRPMKSNYFEDCWDTVPIISEELGYSIKEFLDFRGWSFHRGKDATPSMRYHPNRSLSVYDCKPVVSFGRCLQEVSFRVSSKIQASFLL
jgi:hypothetical protein